MSNSNLAVATDAAIPCVLKTRGYINAHPRPLASECKAIDGCLAPRRTDPKTAWRKPYIELNPPNACNVIVLDCDSENWMLGAMRQLVPKPSYVITEHRRDRSQLGWILKSPVHFNGDASRVNPQVKLAKVIGKMTALFEADPRFNNRGIARNPVYESANIKTTWCDYRVKGFTLDALNFESDLDALPPRVLLEQSAYGRNVSLFESVAKFAGSWLNRDADLYAEALRLNRQFERPLGESEVRGIAKSVTKLRDVWIAEGRYYHMTRDSDYQRQAQASKVAAHWNSEATIERDVAILRRRIAGESVAAIADGLTLERRTVSRVLNRPARLSQLLRHMQRGAEYWQARRLVDAATGSASERARQAVRDAFGRNRGRSMPSSELLDAVMRSAQCGKTTANEAIGELCDSRRVGFSGWMRTLKRTRTLENGD